MKRGTLSLLFGVHQFLWHPIVVGRAWRALYKQWPGLYEWVAIITHDTGYLNLGDMDGAQGVRHPERSQIVARWVVRKLAKAGTFRRRITGEAARAYIHSRVIESDRIVRFHSREMVRLDTLYLRGIAKKEGARGWWANELADLLEPSELCWPDKYSVVFEPAWFYLLRARLTGELEEFRLNAINGGYIEKDATGRDWFNWYRNRVKNLPEIKALLCSPAS